MAIHYIALAQATDILGIKVKLCSASRRAYDAVRDIQPVILEDTPFYKEISAVITWLKRNPLDLAQS